MVPSPTTEAFKFFHREHVDIEEIEEVRFWSGRGDPKVDLDELDEYVADDEYDRDQSTLDSSDVDWDSDQPKPRPKFQPLFPEIWNHKAKEPSPSTASPTWRSTHANGRLSECFLSTPLREVHNFRATYDEDSDEDDSDLEDLYVEHDCTPNCTICRLRATIYSMMRHPEFELDCDEEDSDVDEGPEDDLDQDTADFDDDTTCSSVALHTHYLPDCPACVREQLRAEGWNFPVYQYEGDAETDRKDEEEGRKDPVPDMKEQAQEKPNWFSNVFSPPPPGFQFNTTLASSRSSASGTAFPRVFFRPSEVEKSDGAPAPEGSLTIATSEQGMHFRVLSLRGGW